MAAREYEVAGRLAGGGVEVGGDEDGVGIVRVQTNPAGIIILACVKGGAGEGDLGVMPFRAIPPCEMVTQILAGLSLGHAGGILLHDINQPGAALVVQRESMYPCRSEEHTSELQSP